MGIYTHITRAWSFNLKEWTEVLWERMVRNTMSSKKNKGFCAENWRSERAARAV
jgi:hypothetical protein